MVKKAINYPDIASQITHQAICDICDEQITGIRFKCMNCQDFDLCSNCEKNFHTPETNNHQKDKHYSSHILMKLYFPLQKFERVKQYSVIFTQPKVDDMETLSSVSCNYFQFNINMFGISNIRVIGTNEVNKLHRGIICDICESAVIGIRYVKIFTFNSLYYN